MVHFRKYGPYFVLGIVLLSFLCLGSYWYFLKREYKEIRHEVRTVIKDQVDRSELTLLTFSPFELTYKVHWKHKGEFKYHGEMYDIIEKEYKNGLVYYYCWKDNAESELNKKMDQLIAFVLGHGEKQQKEKENLQRLQRTLFCQELGIKPFLRVNFTERINDFLCQKMASFELIPPTPPPESII